ncbi:FAD-dependent oxidoreductase [Bacteroides ovatus]|uniref:FAD-dependent oxidoreductase n=1 Tax=Bacteroides ovatus TaxID=28116 RepID=UPI0035253EAA
MEKMVKDTIMTFSHPDGLLLHCGNCLRQGVRILLWKNNYNFFSRVAAVEMSVDDTIDAIIVANRSRLVAFKAEIFIDATGDGDVAACLGRCFV